jgi:hypothetical protein
MPFEIMRLHTWKYLFQNLTRALSGSGGIKNPRAKGKLKPGPSVIFVRSGIESMRSDVNLRCFEAYYWRFMRNFYYAWRIFPCVITDYHAYVLRIMRMF